MHLNTAKKYLLSDEISTDEKKLLFALKTRAVNVKTNYSSNLTNMQCRFCRKNGEEESELHVMHCENIISDINLKNDLETISYEDIFGSMDKQILVANFGRK